jgi:RNA polymerase sigma-70 factor, ECF subfamily
MTAGSFEEFYRTTYRGLVAQLVTLTGSLLEAQDIAQEAYVRAWTSWRRIRDYEDPRAWVSRVGHHMAISRWRKAKVAMATWIRHGPSAPPPEPDPATQDLVAALKRLPEAQRRALVMFYIGGFSVQEIARSETVAEGTIKARLSRGRQALAPLLADPEIEDVSQR